jgi:serine/threonine-protein kinase
MTELGLTCPACGAVVLDIDVYCGACGAGLTSTGAQRRVGTTVLEQYQVTEVLGQGGMSVVYRGRHLLTQQVVALKILPPDLAAYAHLKSRFVEEARALAQLDHPGIVHLYNFGQEDDSFVLAMQFVQGRTWERMIVEQGRLDWRTSVGIAIEVLDALEYAHGRGVIHRDMKPSNVVVRDDGSVTVMDFGIAKMTTSSRLTATGQTMGTVRYMSPEQVRGAEVDRRTDLYSLACALYESLTGRTPFDGESHFAIMTAHLSNPVPPLDAGELPAGLEAVLMSALAKAPADRPASAAAFRDALVAIRAGEPTAVRSPSASFARVLPTAPTVAASTAPERPVRRSRVPLVLATVVVAGAGATAVWLARGDRERTADDAVAAPAARAAPAAPAWPDAFLLPDLALAVDRRYEADRLRVASVAARDPDELRAAFVAAQDRFVAMLEAAGVAGAGRQPLNLVVVPRAVLCDRRIYEKGSSLARCAEATLFLRARDQTAYVADVADSLASDLAQAAAANVCLHARAGACEAIFDRFLDDLDRAAAR